MSVLVGLVAGLAVIALWVAVILRSAQADERADPAKIHRLEFELGFHDDPPPSRTPSAANIHGALKDAYTNPSSGAHGLWQVHTDKPGAVIEYDPKNPFSRAAILRYWYEPQVMMPPPPDSDSLS